ncbi:hypothetical protein B9Z19DRAFT_1144046 [Tuber borchii]|uniref:DUF6536 domain-containing protein n=1 Tax=Tuber borchii TaxID=42251 RepID=A0A2T6ZR99_TUBBO|nr:hypothetical protein B9Z19DRAFT_1144046 [Tuber borchii]
MESESTQERSNSFSSAWKPVWYTGWHTGVLACAASTVVVLFINVGLTIYAATNSLHKMERGIGTLYEGSCDTSRTIGLWLHLGINALSTLLLSGSNYTQQCLAAPTRSEIDAAHAKRQWMDIGVPSVRNLFRIKPERRLMWIAIGVTSIPLHLLYNSAVYTSLKVNDYLITTVTNHHFEPGTYRNATRWQILAFQVLSLNTTPRKGYRDSENHTNSSFKLFSSMLEGLNPSTPEYEDLTPLNCAEAYSTEFVSNRSNLFLIANRSSNTTHNDTILDMIRVRSNEALPSNWRCAYPFYERGKDFRRCNTSEPSVNLTSQLAWRVELKTGEEVEVAGCKSEITSEKCTVRFSLGIMIAVIGCNLVKACCMVMTVVRSREPTLVTLGDAVDSFLRNPDPTTIGVCFADRRYIERNWRRQSRAQPRRWKQRGVQRWWTSVSKKRRMICNFFCSITLIFAGMQLRNGMVNDRVYYGSIDPKSMWARGLGKVNSVSLVNIRFPNITLAILLANLPQTILSFLYLTYNSLFTCMLLGHEWSLFSHHHRTLRVTSPRPGQRSTYWLQIPYTYAIPLMTLSGLLHWLTSQSLFLARADIFDPFGRETSAPVSTVGYSCVAIIFVLALGILALLTAAGMGYKKFAAEITTVSSCSVAISAACHASEEDPEEIIGKKVRWGDVGIMQNLGVRHLTFSSEGGVKKPVFGEVYAGTIGEGE